MTTLKSFSRSTGFGAVVLFGAVGIYSACSSLKCGTGTVEKEGECVLDDGAGGAGGADSGVVELTFDGVAAAAPASTTSLFVAWNSASDPDATYNIYVASDAKDFNFAAPQATAPKGSTTTIIPGLKEGKTYYVAVRAVLGGVVFANDEVVTAVPSDDSKAPAFSGVAKGTTKDGSGVELSWTAGSDGDKGTPAAGLVYLVYAGQSAEEIDLDVPLAASEPGATKLTVHLPLPETEYVFIVRARDGAGNIDDNTKTVTASSGKDVEAPSFGGCTAAVAKSASALAVTWSPATDDTTVAELLKYNVYVSKTPTGHNFGSPNATITGALQGIVEGLEKSTEYYVVCRAADEAENEDENTRLQIAKTKSDGVPPVFAGLKTIQNVGSTTAELVWDPATDNQTKPEDIVYDVFVALAPGAEDYEAAPLATSEPGATGMTIEGLPSRKLQYLVVRARDAALNLSETIVEQSLTTKVSLLNDIEIPIFSVKCVDGCHSGASPAGNMNLSPGLSFFQTVGVQAQSYPAEVRVVASDAVNSHLVKRITSTGGAGEPQKMPASGDALSTEQIVTIKAWITEGALNN